MPKIEQKLIDDIVNAFVQEHAELQSQMGNILNGVINGERATYVKLAVIHTLQYLEEHKTPAKI